MSIPICCVTGLIAGDSDACGDCDPCGAASSVPDAVKRLLAERDEWREKYDNAISELDAHVASESVAGSKYLSGLLTDRADALPEDHFECQARGDFVPKSAR